MSIVRYIKIESFNKIKYIKIRSSSIVPCILGTALQYVRPSWESLVPRPVSHPRMLVTSRGSKHQQQRFSGSEMQFRDQHFNSHSRWFWSRLLEPHTLRNTTKGKVERFSLPAMPSAQQFPQEKEIKNALSFTCIIHELGFSEGIVELLLKTLFLS